MAFGVMYLVASIVTGIIAVDFWRSKDGELRLILCSMFLAYCLHYLALSMLWVFMDQPTGFPRSVVISIAVPIEIAIMVWLYYYIRWKH